MARAPRKSVVHADNLGVYHCIQRCIRRVFLCETDAVSGASIEYQRAWIQTRLEFLVGVSPLMSWHLLSCKIGGHPMLSGQYCGDLLGCFNRNWPG